MPNSHDLATTTAMARATPRWQLVAILAALAMLGPFSVDTYMPSFRAIGASLNATQIEVQQTLSSYLLAFAFMLLFHGSLSDAFGRRSVILVSLVAFLVGSIGCALSYDIATLWLFRAVQGAAAGAGMVVGRAMVRDLFHGHEAQRTMSYITLVFGLAPAIAPIIGGWLQVGFGWHSIFVFLAIITVALFWLAYAKLPESLPTSQRTKFHPVLLLRSYRSAFTNKRFLLLASAVGFNFTGFFLYIAAAPVFIMDLLGLGEHQFAWLFIPGIVGIMSGAYISGRLAGRFSPERSIRLGYIILGVAAGLNLLYNLLFPLGLPWAVLLIGLYTVGMSIAMPSISLLILDLFPRTRGMAASLQAFLSSMMNAAVSGMLAPALSHSRHALALGMVLLLGAGFSSWCAYQMLRGNSLAEGQQR
jgi:DHA1 family bicyclomycin/chloramphenicol resistance-like MFS transporter